MGKRQRFARFAAWPFLIGRAAVQPIQVVAAPRAMCDARVYGILHQLTAHENYLSSFGHAYWRAWRRLDPSSAFHVAVVFQLIQATERFIGGETDRQLLDRNGRPIQLMEGFACEQMESALFLPGSVLLEVHQHVIGTYRQFWHADLEQSYQVMPMAQLMTESPITSAKGVTEGVVALHQLEPYISDTPLFEGLRFISTHAGEDHGPVDEDSPSGTLASETASDSVPSESTPRTTTETTASAVGAEPNAIPLQKPSRRQRWNLLPWRH